MRKATDIGKLHPRLREQAGPATLHQFGEVQGLRGPVGQSRTGTGRHRRVPRGTNPGRHDADIGTACGRIGCVKPAGSHRAIGGMRPALGRGNLRRDVRLPRRNCQPISLLA